MLVHPRRANKKIPVRTYPMYSMFFVRLEALYYCVPTWCLKHSHHLRLLSVYDCYQVARGLKLCMYIVFPCHNDSSKPYTRGRGSKIHTRTESATDLCGFLNDPTIYKYLSDLSSFSMLYLSLFVFSLFFVSCCLCSFSFCCSSSTKTHSLRACCGRGVGKMWSQRRS